LVSLGYGSAPKTVPGREGAAKRIDFHRGKELNIFVASCGGVPARTKRWSNVPPIGHRRFFAAREVAQVMNIMWPGTSHWAEPAEETAAPPHLTPAA
jgi:hypothetical protein